MNKIITTDNKNRVGITLKDINLRSDLSSSVICEIQDLLNKFRLVVFRNQQLSDEELSDFAYRFGPPFTPDNRFPVLGSQDSLCPIVIVGNQADEYEKSYLGFQEVLPHSDHQWLKCPSSASMLYAIDIHRNSAPTIWYDMVQAYNSLDKELKKIIDELKIITYNPFYRPFGSLDAKYVERSKNIPPGNTFPHPVVRTHPLTKEKLLYMNIAYEVEFENISYNEGVELFNKLKNHIINLDYKYEHNWENNDLVFWDNRATIHYRPPFDSNVRRVLKRITIGGEKPF
jgi:taurine dioxygenase